MNEGKTDEAVVFFRESLEIEKTAFPHSQTPIAMSELMSCLIVTVTRGLVNVPVVPV